MTSTRPPKKPFPLENHALEPSTLDALGAMAEEGYARHEAKKEEYEKRVVPLYPELQKYGRGCLDERADVEDAMQNVSLRAWKKDVTALCASEGDLRRYMLRSMHNEIVNHHRRRRKERRKLAALTSWIRTKPPDPEEPLRHTDSSDIDAHVSHGVGKLPLSCREAWVLVHMLEMTYAEAADLLDVSEKTIDNQVAHANGLLRKMLRAVGYYEERRKQGEEKEQV